MDPFKLKIYNFQRKSSQKIISRGELKCFNMPSRESQLNLVEDPGPVTPIDFERLFSEKSYQEKFIFYNEKSYQDKFVIRKILFLTLRFKFYSMENFQSFVNFKAKSDKNQLMFFAITIRTF